MYTGLIHVLVMFLTAIKILLKSRSIAPSYIFLKNVVHTNLQCKATLFQPFLVFSYMVLNAAVLHLIAPLPQADQDFISLLQ